MPIPKFKPVANASAGSKKIIKSISIGLLAILAAAFGLEATNNDGDLGSILKGSSRSDAKIVRDQNGNIRRDANGQILTRVMRDKKGNVVPDGTTGAKYTDELQQPVVTFNLVDTVPNYSSLSPMAQNFLGKIDGYVSLYGNTADLSNALASLDASAQTKLSGAEQEVVLSTSSGTVSSSAYWETNMYSWAALYRDTTTIVIPYSISVGSLRSAPNPDFDIRTPPTVGSFSWGSCWGYLNTNACTAAKQIIGADLAGLAGGAVRAWYSGAFLGGPVGVGVIAGTGVAVGAGASAAAGGGAVVHGLLQTQ